MLFGKEDFDIGNPEEFSEFALIFIFIALVAPLIIAAYTLGFVLDKTGWLDTTS
ncbi:MAG: hypothetical protein NT027_15665 [Proteobacteria bacterium]|jgi:hypothetical protein|nr:hypothetical protein [Pseudomonadota bacterium]